VRYFGFRTTGLADTNAVVQRKEAAMPGA